MEAEPHTQEPRDGAPRRAAPAWLLYLVFFAICLGTGYPTLNRYDPREGGTSDARHYFAMVEASRVEGHEASHPNATVFRARVLVPTVARVVHPLLRGRVGSWSPVATAMLLANALFVAGTALVLVHVARRTTGRDDLALVAALLYLADFAVGSYHLAGLVDSSEAFCLALLVYLCVESRWSALPALGALGAGAKETFLPLSLVFLGAWWWASRSTPASRPPLGLIALTAVVGTASFALVRRVVIGDWLWPWDVASTVARPALLEGLVGVVDRPLVYVFGWLLPLGALGMRRLPAPWRYGTAASALAAIAFAAWAHGPAVRLLFDLAGPLLALGAAITLLGPGRDQPARSTAGPPITP